MDSGPMVHKNDCRSFVLALALYVFRYSYIFSRWPDRIIEGFLSSFVWIHTLASYASSVGSTECRAFLRLASVLRRGPARLVHAGGKELINLFAWSELAGSYSHIPPLPFVFFSGRNKKEDGSPKGWLICNGRTAICRKQNSITTIIRFLLPSSLKKCNYRFQGIKKIKFNQILYNNLLTFISPNRFGMKV